MRLGEFLTESQQQEMAILQEGPLGSLARAAGRGLGNVIGGVAKGVGAVKGAVKGAVDRVKKDFAAGEKGAYAAVSGQPDRDPAMEPKTTSGVQSPARPTTRSSAAADTDTDLSPDADDDTPQTPAGQPAATTTEKPPATAPAPSTVATKGTTAGATQSGNTATVAANDTEYAKTQKAIDALPAEQRKEIISLLQADPNVKAALAKSVAKKPPTTVTTTVKQKQLTPSAFGQMAQDLTKQQGNVK